MKISIFFSYSLTLLTVITQVLSSVAQVNDFAPIGAKWYYDSMDSGMAPPHSEYFLYQSIKDTIVLSVPCKKIEVSKYGYYNTVELYSPIFVYGDSNEVFYYNELHNEFCSLYKFNVSVGDTLIYCSPPSIFVTDSTFRVIVDSIYYQVISNKGVKFIYTLPLPTLSGYSFSYWGSYAQYIGGLNNIFPQLSPNIPEMDGPLRCYGDSAFFFNNNWSLSCDFRIIDFNSVSNTFLSNDLTINYNYNKEVLIIKDNYKEPIHLLIYDIYGNCLYNESLHIIGSTEIDLSFLCPGVHIVNAISNNRSSNIFQILTY
jgi:hypothetical protein